MKLLIVAVGNKMPAWVAEGFAEYAKRMPRESVLALIEIKPENRTTGKTAPQMMAAEAERIRAALPAGVRMIALDERGADWTTRQLADKFSGWMQEGRDVAFIIGGADGLDPALKKEADNLLRLSSLTLPHGLARVLLAEQLYRASSLLNNHPYHRE
jgi:23S rRNA (pseudouridine1915-N3)-methyltransferase